MSKISETIRDKSIELLLSGASGLLLVLLGILVNSFGAPFLEKVLPEIDDKSYLAIIGILLLLLAISAVTVLILWSKTRGILKRSDYEFDSRRGIYRHKVDGLYYCTSCFVSNMQSPLQEHETGWLCLVKSCSKFYSNPDNPPGSGFAREVTNAPRPWDQY